MKREVTHYSCLLGVCFALNLQAQIADDFSDGNFSSSPVWTGNDTDFIVNTNQQLQLQSSGTGISYLSLMNAQTLAGASWEAWARLNFAPSSSNFARLYLVSDQQTLNGPLNGYYLQFGETGSADQVELFRQSGSSSVSVCRGTTSIATAFAIRIRVQRDGAGNWSLFLDPSGGNNFAQEASGFDNAYTANSFSGVYCKYTSTNAASFFFDDFYFYSPPDTSPPQLDTLTLEGPKKLKLIFNEGLDSVSANSPGNYSIDNGMGSPVLAARDSASHQIVMLDLNAALKSGTTYKITVSGIKDKAGNSNPQINYTFSVYFLQAFDVVIHEIMADVNPAPAGLPPYEYVELFNRTTQSIRLKDWTLSDPTSTAKIPDIVIEPDSFYLLTSISAASAFGNGIAVVGLSAFPSLNDGGDQLVLKDEKSRVISFLNYSPKYYNDPLRADGGWSMEMRDADCFCGGSENWRASTHSNGGTPGKRNSAESKIGDAVQPELVRLAVLDSLHIQLFFSEPMDSAGLLNVTLYDLQPGMNHPLVADPVGPDHSSVVLTLPGIIQQGIVYFVRLISVFDCVGNPAEQPAELSFGRSEPPLEKDLVINEILFDPLEGGVEWIEIYNRSERIISLKDVYLCTRNDTGGLADIRPISPEGVQILPGYFKVLSTDGRTIRKQYEGVEQKSFIDMNSFLSLSNEGDHIVLTDINQKIIDEVAYEPDWHLPILEITKGITLERIHYDLETQRRENWHSAAEDAGFGTPGKRNSQFTDGEGSSILHIEPEVFSPDNDGHDDVAAIHYQFEEPGNIGNIFIYDAQGRAVRHLIRQELLGTSGTFFWDGMTEMKAKAPLGIYVLYLEVFDMKGNVKRVKKPVVVGGKLRE